jgi:hypothetical protein
MLQSVSVLGLRQFKTVASARRALQLQHPSTDVGDSAARVHAIGDEIDLAVL